MIQQLKFSPVENVLTVLFVVVILGYLLYLLDRSIQNKQRGKHTVSRAKVVSKEQSTAVGQPVYLADGMVNSGITETENVKSVILKIWRNRENRSPWKSPTESTENCRKATAEVSATGAEN